jgi:hypothetical protein
LSWTGILLSALRRSFPSTRCRSIQWVLKVTRVTALTASTLALEFNDGAAGEVDCSFLLGQGLGADLDDAGYFRQVGIEEELGTVVWPNGLDPAPQLLRQRLSTLGVTPAA